VVGDEHHRLSPSRARCRGETIDHDASPSQQARLAGGYNQPLVEATASRAAGKDELEGVPLAVLVTLDLDYDLANGALGCAAAITS
jgi:hypothetical protein